MPRKVLPQILSDRTYGLLMAGLFVLGVTVGGMAMWESTTCELHFVPPAELLEDARRVENLLAAEGINVRGFAGDDLPALAMPATLPERCQSMVRAAALTRLAFQRYGITAHFAMMHYDDQELAREYENDMARAIAAVFDDTDKTYCLLGKGK